jgi:hypothetical protein
MTKEELLLEVRKLSDEDRELFIWELFDLKLRPWTEAQQLSYLLDVITCPEGHVGPFQRFWVEGVCQDAVDSKGELLPDEEQENFNLPGYFVDGFYCKECSRLKILPHDFSVPHYISSRLSST